MWSNNPCRWFFFPPFRNKLICDLSVRIVRKMNRKLVIYLDRYLRTYRDHNLRTNKNSTFFFVFLFLVFVYELFGPLNFFFRELSLEFSFKIDRLHLYRVKLHSTHTKKQQENPNAMKIKKIIIKIMIIICLFVSNKNEPKPKIFLY